MSDQFGSNLNSLEYALTGHNEQEFIENLQIDIPKMEHQPAIIEMERLEQPSNVSPTVSPRIENPQKQIIPDQQNILVSFSTKRPLLRPSTFFLLDRSLSPRLFYAAKLTMSHIFLS